jgi:hypothetical protein
MLERRSCHRGALARPRLIEKAAIPPVALRFVRVQCPGMENRRGQGVSWACRKGESAPQHRRGLTGWSARLWRVLIYDVTGEGFVTLPIGRCCFSTTDTCPRASPLTAREAARGAPGPASFGGRGRNPARAPPKGDGNRAPPVLLRILSGLSAPPDMTKRRGKRPGLRLKSRG